MSNVLNQSPINVCVLEQMLDYISYILRISILQTEQFNQSIQVYSKHQIEIIYSFTPQCNNFLESD